MTDSSSGLHVRRDRVGRILLLKCALSGMKGAVALGRIPCELPWHIAIRTDNFQHPGCIDFKLSEDRTFERGNADPKKYSATYTVSRGAGTFHAYLRWQSGHSPYPEIRSMEVWCYGVYLGARDYPKANDGYIDVAEITVDENGYVTVNGLNAGRWSDMILEG